VFERFVSCRGVKGGFGISWIYFRKKSEGLNTVCNTQMVERAFLSAQHLREGFLRKLPRKVTLLAFLSRFYDRHFQPVRLNRLPIISLSSERTRSFKILSTERSFCVCQNF
jgi:hypothetical protein